MEIRYNSIGKIRTEHTTKSGIPIQSAKADSRGFVELNEDYKEGLQNLDGFSHIYLIYHFHLSKDFPLKAVPFLDDKEHGIFAIRAPKRPNPIGFSIVKLERIEDNIIYFEGADMLDDTPLLDIKPYVSKFDRKDNTKDGWLEKEKGSYISDDRF